MFVFRMRAVHRRDLRNVATFEFASQRVPRGQKTLSGIGKRFPDPYNAGVLRWDQTVTAAEVARGANPRCARRRCQSPGDKRAPCEKCVRRAFSVSAEYVVACPEPSRR